MKKLLQWLRGLYWAEDAPTYFEELHYAKFLRAVEESDVEAYVYDEHVKGQIIVLKGEDLHAVTVNNLVSFRKMTRSERRYIDKKYKAYQARPGENEKDRRVHR